MGHRLFIVAGEASADMHAAAMVQALKKQDPGLRYYGVGGNALRAEGVEIVVDSSKLNVVGITDWWDRFGEVLGLYRQLVRMLRQDPPDCAVLLDLPDFNLRLAKTLKRLGVPVVYYISPQVWAWRRYRVKTIRSHVDRMLVVFPFERQFYESRGVDAVFVGHPLLEKIKPRETLREKKDIISAPRIALLPGSRGSEVRYHSQVLRAVAEKIRKNYPGATMKVPVASTLQLTAVKDSMGNNDIEFCEGDSLSVLSWADLAVVASGTATLETALLGTPFCLIYRLSRISHFVMRHLVRYRGFLGMPNLLLKREVVKEFVQNAADPETIFDELKRLIEDGDYYGQMHRELMECRQVLGSGGASDAVASEISRIVKNRSEKSGR